MLTHLSICNVVLIEKLEVDFSNGLTIFSGETGAGKSILLDSLGFILGSRSETSMIRQGQEKLTVTGIFDLQNKQSPLYEILQKNEIETELFDDIIIKRTLDKTGKSRIFFNDCPISLKLLKQISPYLVACSS